MKQLFYSIVVCVCFVAIPAFAFAQDVAKSVFKYDKAGNVKSVTFSASDKEYEHVKSAEVFFREILNANENVRFVKNKSIRLEGKNETYEQYYKGIKVENAGYTFHYDENGLMKYAHGKYVSIANLDTSPSISKEEACKAFARYEGLSPESITDSSAELLIKSVKGKDSSETPLLVYKISIGSDSVCIPEYGYVDAKTGKVVKTESYINHTAATGTFYTKYYGTKTATTNLSSSKYYLNDPTRGYGIETKDLHNNYYNSNLLFALPISDSDNMWYYSDFADSTFMALDVHWALQKIFDRLYYNHGIIGMDNNGKKIKAYVRAKFLDAYGDRYDNACWDNNREALFFGSGSGTVDKRPESSLDIVAHEYGHGITHYQIGWSHDEDYLNEGLSDIWGAIMDYRYGDNNTEVWGHGEHIPQSYACIRDMSSTQSISAMFKMADTYYSSKYLDYVNDDSYYGMSGVFSHWFYLLVNGGQANNSNGVHYILSPLSMDIAERLIVRAVYDNYLRYTTSYEDVREAFVAAAAAMNVSGLVSAVRNAWFAVGVGDMDLSLTGPVVINNQEVYTVVGLPTGYNVVWSLSNSYYNTNCLEQATPAFNKCRITRSTSQDMTNATLTASIKYGTSTIQTLTKTGVYAHAGFKGTYISSHGNGTVNPPNPIFTTSGTAIHISSPNLIGATISYSGSITPSYWLPGYNTLDVTIPTGTLVVYVACDNGTSYSIPIIASSSKSYLSYDSKGELLIVLFDESVSDNLPKAIEVYNTVTGEKMATRECSGRSVSINTSGWKKSIFAVKVTVGNETWGDKFMNK